MPSDANEDAAAGDPRGDSTELGKAECKQVKKPSRLRKRGKSAPAAADPTVADHTRDEGSAFDAAAPDCHMAPPAELPRDCEEPVSEVVAPDLKAEAATLTELPSLELVPTPNEQETTRQLSDCSKVPTAASYPSGMPPCPLFMSPAERRAKKLAAAAQAEAARHAEAPAPPSSSHPGPEASTDRVDVEGDGPSDPVGVGPAAEVVGGTSKRRGALSRRSKGVAPPTGPASDAPPPPPEAVGSDGRQASKAKRPRRVSEPHLEAAAPEPAAADCVDLSVSPAVAKQPPGISGIALPPQPAVTEETKKPAFALFLSAAERKRLQQEAAEAKRRTEAESAAGLIVPGGDGEATPSLAAVAVTAPLSAPPNPFFLARKPKPPSSNAAAAQTGAEAAPLADVRARRQPLGEMMPPVHVQQLEVSSPMREDVPEHSVLEALVAAASARGRAAAVAPDAAAQLAVLSARMLAERTRSQARAASLLAAARFWPIATPAQRESPERSPGAEMCPDPVAASHRLPGNEAVSSAGGVADADDAAAGTSSLSATRPSGNALLRELARRLALEALPAPSSQGLEGLVDLPSPDEIHSQLSHQAAAIKAAAAQQRLSAAARGEESTASTDMLQQGGQLPWAQKYQPASAEGVCGNADGVGRLRSWLSGWNERMEGGGGGGDRRPQNPMGGEHDKLGVGPHADDAEK